MAESTGKAGRGIVPVVGEPLGDAGGVRGRPAFVVIAWTGDSRSRVGAALADRAGAPRAIPSMRLELADRLDIGAEFVRWEVATAAAGMLLGIDPFDQPNVQEAKDATRGLLDAYRAHGALAAAGAAGGRGRASPPTATPRSWATSR